MFKHLALLLTCLAATPALANEPAANFGPAGIMSHTNKQELPPITLSVDRPLAEAPLHLKSGRYYVIEITADGSNDMGLRGPEFFQAIWISSLEIDDVEIRPLGLDSIDFGDEGTVILSFVAIKPGRYDLHVPGARGDSQRVEISIE